MKKLEDENTMVFIVHNQATKPQIRRAFEKVHGVKVRSVNVNNAFYIYRPSTPSKEKRRPTLDCLLRAKHFPSPTRLVSSDHLTPPYSTQKIIYHNFFKMISQFNKYWSTTRQSDWPFGSTCWACVWFSSSQNFHYKVKESSEPSMSSRLSATQSSNNWRVLGSATDVSRIHGLSAYPMRHLLSTGYSSYILVLIFHP